MRYLAMGLDQWADGDGLRFATEAEAQAFLDHYKTERDDLVATRIVPSPKEPTMVWFFDKNMMGQPAKRGLTIKRPRRPDYRRNPY
jgi:hypothetical protein